MAKRKLKDMLENAEHSASGRTQRVSPKSERTVIRKPTKEEDKWQSRINLDRKHHRSLGTVDTSSLKYNQGIRDYYKNILGIDDAADRPRSVTPRVKIAENPEMEKMLKKLKKQ